MIIAQSMRQCLYIFSEDENSYSNIFNDLQNLDEIQYDQLSLINLEVNYFEIQH